MPNTPKNITPSGGFWHNIALQIKLFLRLMGDNRVNPFIKLIPFVSLVYLINPFDIPGPLDDVAVAGLGIYLFIELCPQDVVQEHLRTLRNTTLDDETFSEDQGEIIDAEFHEEGDE